MGLTDYLKKGGYGLAKGVAEQNKEQREFNKKKELIGLQDENQNVLVDKKIAATTEQNRLTREQDKEQKGMDRELEKSIKKADRQNRKEIAGIRDLYGTKAAGKAKAERDRLHTLGYEAFTFAQDGLAPGGGKPKQSEVFSAGAKYLVENGLVKNDREAKAAMSETLFRLGAGKQKAGVDSKTEVEKRQLAIMNAPKVYGDDVWKKPDVVVAVYEDYRKGGGEQSIEEFLRGTPSMFEDAEGLGTGEVANVAVELWDQKQGQGASPPPIGNETKASPKKNWKELPVVR